MGFVEWIAALCPITLLVDLQPSPLFKLTHLLPSGSCWLCSAAFLTSCLSTFVSGRRQSHAQSLGSTVTNSAAVGDRA